MDIMIVKVKNEAVDSLIPKLIIEFTFIDTEQNEIRHDTSRVFSKDTSEIMQDTLRSLTWIVEQEQPDKVLFDTNSVDITRELQLLWQNR